ncbi:hypothetical protein E2320_000739 [Naja naja]|nr:hypothetical protein E2320_000739 [Naja naja]
MKSIAILLLLAFLTGFQAAVLNEAPPPSNSEPKQQSVLEQLQGHLENFSGPQSILEQLQGHLGKFSTQVTETVNGSLDTMKGHLSDAVVYLTEMGKKGISTKNYNRKFGTIFRELYQNSQSAFNQGKEAVKDQIITFANYIKKHPAVMALNEEVVSPVVKSGSSLVSFAGDQSLASISTAIRNNIKS